MIDKLILGTVQFGLNYGINNSNGKPTKQNVFKILSYAYENGIRYLDTAELYGNAHDIIGEFHKKNPSKKFNIITKLPHHFNEDIESKINIYLSQLNVEYLHGILFHSFDSYNTHKLELNKSYFNNKKNIEYVGVSIYNNDQIEVVLNDKNIDVIQLPFNLFDNLNQRGEYIKKAKIKNKIIHTRSAFLQGLFFMDKNKSNRIQTKLEFYLDLIKKISKKSSIPIASLALGYCLSQPEIDRVLIGIDSLGQLESNIIYSKIQIPNQYLEEINKIKIENIDLLNPSMWA